MEVQENSSITITDELIIHYRGSGNGGFQTVVRVWSGEQIPAPHFV